jgi:hypothetical protein
MRDAGSTNFKAFSQLIKKEMQSTKETGEILLGNGPTKSSL